MEENVQRESQGETEKNYRKQKKIHTFDSESLFERGRINWNFSFSSSCNNLNN